MRRDDGLEALRSRSLLARRPRASRPKRSLPPPVIARVRAALLLRRPHPPEDESRLIAEARTFALSVPAPVRLQVCVSLDGAQAHIYAWMEPVALGAFPANDHAPTRLAPLAEWDGVSAGEDAPYHYVVATDVDPQNEADFNRWYDTEHMPGLAAVPGTVHCARLISAGAGPRYHACYDLVSPEVMEGPEWLAVRHTPWSSRVRPHFVDPRRMMFRTLVDERRLAVSGAYF